MMPPAFTVCLVAVAGLATVVETAVGPKSVNNGSNVAFAGVVSESMCGPKHMINNDDAKCVRKCVKGGSQYVLLTGEKTYTLGGTTQGLEEFAGKTVRVTAILEGSDLQVSSVEEAANSPTRSATGEASADDSGSAGIDAIEGLVRDIACPMQNKAATAITFNPSCARECARLGSPLILLTNDGVLYTPISEDMPDKSQRERLMPYVGKFVRVKGQVFERAGTHAIAIREIKEIRNVHFVTNAE